MNQEVLDYTKDIPDRYNPFNNDTENRNYRDDYRKIVPQIAVRGCVIPKVPSKFEKRNIKSVYNRTASTLIVHLVVTNVLATIVSAVVALVASAYVNASVLDSFLSDTSLYMCIIAITYTFANLIAVATGCKLLHLPISRMFNKPTVTTPEMVRHITIAWCLQGVCMVVVSILYAIGTYYGVDLIPDSPLSDASYTSVTYCIATFLYSCIIAPITEEMLFRGIVLRGFSTVSQSFGIFMSALLFGLLHGNILQTITTFTVGLYLAFVATKYDSILPTIVIHFFINLVPTVIEIALSYDEDMYNYAMYGFYAIMIVVGIVFICTGYRKQSNRLPVQNEHQRKRTLPLALTSLGVVTILVLYVGTMLVNHLM